MRFIIVSQIKIIFLYAKFVLKYNKQKYACENGMNCFCFQSLEIYAKLPKQAIKRKKFFITAKKFEKFSFAKEIMRVIVYQA